MSTLTKGKQMKITDTLKTKTISQTKNFNNSIKKWCLENKQLTRGKQMKQQQKQLVNKKEVAHWLGHSYQEWIHSLIYRLVNKKISTTDIKVEMKQMYKDYKNN